MKIYLSCLSCLLAIVLCAHGEEPQEHSIGMAAPQPRQMTAEDLELCKAHIKEMRTQINLLNLINGLHLTPQQIRLILQGAQALQSLRGQRLSEKERRQQLKEERRLLKQARRSLLSRGEIHPAIMAQYQRLRRRQRQARARVRPEEIQARTLVWEKRIAAQLTAAQRQVLSTYKPCLLPPKNLKDPVRVGQASDASRWEKALSRIRSIPAEIWQAKKMDILGRMLQKVQYHEGVYNEAEAFVQLYAWLSVAQKARKMDDVDFELSKSELAKEFEPYHKKEILLDKVHSVYQQSHRPGKIAHFLLTPHIIPLLQRRLCQLQHPPEHTQTDLSKIKGVQKEKGKCAID